MLLGEFTCASENGRLSLPAPFRPALERGLTLTRGIEKCLLIFPTAEWQALVQRIRAALPLTSRDGRSFSRLLFAAALACFPDRQGRIPLPANLRQYAAVEGEAVLVGLVTHIEVWNPQRWAEVSARVADESAAVAERLSRYGI